MMTAHHGVKLCPAGIMTQPHEPFNIGFALMSCDPKGVSRGGMVKLAEILDPLRAGNRADEAHRGFTRALGITAPDRLRRKSPCGEGLTDGGGGLAPAIIQRALMIGWHIAVPAGFGVTHN